MKKGSRLPRAPTDFKICAICNRQFERKQKTSIKSFATQMTCGRECGRIYQNRNLELLRIFENRSDPLKELLSKMETEMPFARHNHDPGDCGVIRMPGPDPYRFGQSLTGSSAAVAEGQGDKAGTWEKQ